MKRINNTNIVVYKQVNPFRKINGKTEERYVGEIDKRNGMPIKVYGMNPEQLGKLLNSNIRSAEIDRYDFSTDPNERHTRLRDSIAPGTEIKQLSKEEAAIVHAAVSKG
ncbi:hypothetical protein JXA56_04995 [Candidatus Micrarchaeota archaeon]|nr:hypothetical protein [Candidatus Micrarchaeota archaeon]